MDINDEVLLARFLSGEIKEVKFDEQLYTCPFCGGIANLNGITDTLNDDIKCIGAECEKCGARGPCVTVGKNGKQALFLAKLAWNTRY